MIAQLAKIVHALPIHLGNHITGLQSSFAAERVRRNIRYQHALTARRTEVIAQLSGEILRGYAKRRRSAARNARRSPIPFP